MKWVLNTYQTCQDWELDRIIEVCTLTGYEGIELLMDFEQRHGVETGASPAYLEEVSRKVTDAGLFIASLTSAARFDWPDEQVRRRDVDRARRVIEQAQQMGCSHVRVLGDRLPEDGPERSATIENIGAALEELGGFAGDHGVRLSLEMHSHFTDPDLALAVLERAGDSQVGFVFNSQWRVGATEGWSLPEGAASIRPLYDLTGKYFTAVHTHHMDDPAELPYYAELFSLLMEDGFDGFVSNECAYTGPDPERVLRLYTALFRSLTGGATR